MQSQIQNIVLFAWVGVLLVYRLGLSTESQLEGTIVPSWDARRRARRDHHFGKFSAVLALVAVCLLAAGCGPPTRVIQGPDRPNIILILTDDLDARLLEDHMEDYPNLRELAAEGTTFENAFVTDSLCCPSRTSILRGQYAHNHEIVGNSWPRGGSQKFRVLRLGESTVATWLQDEGYRTVLIGKYMNGYYGTRVPVGWDDWYAIARLPKQQTQRERSNPPLQPQALPS